MRDKTLDLYFHSPCFDGVTAAVLCWDFFEQRDEARAVRLHPVAYDIRDRWLATPLPAHAAVVDFLFHPAAGFWADHHATTFLIDALRTQVDTARSPRWVYDPSAPSCATLLRRHLKKHFGYHNDRYDTLVDWAGKIDSASYRSVKEALLAPTAALQISLSLTGADPAFCIRLVRQLKRHSMSRVAGSPMVQRRVRKAKASLKEGLRRLARTVRLMDGEIVVFDVDAGDAPVNRYAPYYFYPRARYSVGALRLGDAVKITAMRNPWRHFESVPIGSILSRYGGGGHQRVGSVLLTKGARRRAPEVLRQLVAEIRERDRANRQAS